MSMERALLCVVTGRYLPMALTMATSYVRYHPSNAVRILLVDVSSSAVSRVNISGWPQLRIDGIDVLDPVRTARMRMYYDAVEMIGATRSAYIRYVFTRDDCDEVVMLDADIYCCRELAPLVDSLRIAPIALTPHINSPVPADGALPDDLELVRGGFINNGCCAMRKTESVWPALDWLTAKVENACFFCPDINLYNEQTWVSFLPWYFPDQVRLVHHPGVNVAYWNLYERRLRRGSGGYEANGEPLCFFHFSGHDRGSPQLTMHSTRTGDRESMIVVRSLVEEYNDALSLAYRAYPQLEADLPCSNRGLAQRLKSYKQVVGEFPSFYGDYKRLRRHGLRRRVRSLISRVAG